MRTGRPFSAVSLAGLAALALAACQSSPDVGQPCTLDVYGADGTTPIDTSVDPTKGLYCSADRADYFLSPARGDECENLVCLRSPTGACQQAGLPPVGVRKYCSKPCVSDDDCFKSDTGLVCRQIVLDPVFLANLDPAVRQKYLGQIQSSSYCATPVPP
jgi:hypothetical protein